MTTKIKSTEQPWILLVDDNHQVRTTLKAVLEADQFLKIAFNLTNP